MALGEASVNVVADTRGFSREVRTAVEAAEKEAHIQLKADVARFRADLQRATRNQAARVHIEATGLVAFRSQITAATRNQKVRVHVEPTGLPAFRAAIVASMKGTNPKIPVLPSVNRGTWRAVINAALAGFSVKVRVEPDVASFRSALARNLLGTQLRPIHIPIRFNPPAGRSAGGIERLLETNTGPLGNVLLSGLGGDVGHIIHNWGRIEYAIRNIGRAFRDLRGAATPAIRSLSSIGSGVATSLREVGQSLRGAFNIFSGTGLGAGLQAAAGQFLSALRGVGQWVSELSQRIHVVAGAFFQLAGAVGQALAPFVQFVGALTAMAGAAAAAYTPIGAVVQAIQGIGAGVAGIPAALGIATAGLLTFKFALTGVGAAFSAAFLQNTDEFERQLKRLGPLQQQFAKTLRAMITPTQKAASTAFLGPVVDALQSLRGTDLGRTLSSGITQAAAAMGNLAAQTLRFFRSVQGTEAVRQSFAALRAIFDGLAAGMPTLLSGFSDAINALLGSSGGIATAVQSVTERFGSFMSRMAVTGAINRGWDQFIQTMRMLISIGANLVRTFNAIAAAMRGASPSGRGPLGAMADGMERIARAARTVQGQQGMISFFTKLRAAGEAVWLMLRKVGEAFGAFASGALSGAGLGGRGAGGGIAAVAQSLGSVFDKYLPAIEQFGAKVGTALRVFADTGGLKAFVENLGRATAGATLLAAKLLQLAGSAAKFFQNLFSGPGSGGGRDFLQMFADLGNAVSSFAANLGKLLAPLGSALVGAFKTALPVIQAVSSAIGLFGNALGKLGPMLAPLTQVAAAFLAMQGAKLVLLALAGAITARVIPAIIAMSTAIKANPVIFALTGIAALASSLVSSFSDVGKAAEQTATDISKIGGSSDAALAKAKELLKRAKSERSDNTIIGSEGSFWSLAWEDDDKFKANEQAAQDKIDEIYAERKARQRERAKQAIQEAAAQAKRERDAYTKAYSGVFEGVAGDIRKSMNLQPEKLFPDLKTAQVGLPPSLANKLKEGITRDMKEVNKIAQKAADDAIKAGQNTGVGQEAYTKLMAQFADAPPNVRAAAQKAWGNSIRKSLDEALKQLAAGKSLNEGQKKLVQDFYDQFNQLVITEGKNAGKTISKSLVDSLSESLDIGKIKLPGMAKGDFFDASKSSALGKLFPALKDMDKNLTDNIKRMIQTGLQNGVIQSEGDVKKFANEINEQISKQLAAASSDKASGRKKKISPRDYFVSAEDLPKDLKPMTDQINNAIQEALTGKDAAKKKKNKIKLEVDADTEKILEEVGTDSKFFNDLKSQLSSTAKNASKGMTEGVGAGLKNEFSDLAKSMVGEGSSFRSKLGSDMKGAMTKMIKTATDTIKSNKGKIKTELNTIPKYVDGKSSFATSLKNNMKSAFSAAMDAAVAGIRSKKGAVQSALNEIKALASQTINVKPNVTSSGYSGTAGGGGSRYAYVMAPGQFAQTAQADQAAVTNNSTTSNAVTINVNSRSSSPELVAHHVMRRLASGLA